MLVELFPCSISNIAEGKKERTWDRLTEGGSVAVPRECVTYGKVLLEHVPSQGYHMCSSPCDSLILDVTEGMLML